MSTAARHATPVGPHPWHITAADYWQMLPLIEGKRVQLIEGVIVEMSPMGALHAFVVSTLTGILSDALGRKWAVRVQLPLEVGHDSVPEPDLAVMTREAERKWLPRVPRTVPFVCEVADTSHRLDRGAKLRLYAAADVTECVIADLKRNALEVYTQPKKLGGYAKKQLIEGSRSYRSTVLPKVVLRPSDIFPSR